MITDPELARKICNQSTRSLAILYDRVLQHRKITRNIRDTSWNINLNIPARSLKGILMLFEDTSDAFARDTEKFYNPEITKVELTIEDVPNQLSSQSMRAYQQWDEIKKLPSIKRSPEVNAVVKDLSLGDVSMAEFLTTKYALWLDMRTMNDDQLHVSGRRIENASEGVAMQITKLQEGAGKLNIYLYVIMDAQLNIQNGRFVPAIY